MSISSINLPSWTGYNATIKYLQGNGEKGPVLKVLQEQKGATPTTICLHVFSDGSAHSMVKKQNVASHVTAYNKGTFSKFLGGLNEIIADSKKAGDFIHGLNKVIITNLIGKTLDFKARRTIEYKIPKDDATIKFMLGQKANRPVLKITQDNLFDRLMTNATHPRILHVNSDGSGFGLIRDSLFERLVVYKKGEFSETLKKFKSVSKSQSNLRQMLAEINQTAISVANGAQLGKSTNTYLKQIKDLPPGTFGEVIFTRLDKIIMNFLKNAKNYIRR